MRRQSDSVHSDAGRSIIRASCSRRCFALRSAADIDSENIGLRPRLIGGRDDDLGDCLFRGPVMCRSLPLMRLAYYSLSFACLLMLFLLCIQILWLSRNIRKCGLVSLSTPSLTSSDARSLFHWKPWELTLRPLRWQTHNLRHRKHHTPCHWGSLPLLC